MATIANQYDPNNPNGTNTGGSGTVMPSTNSGDSGSGGSALGGSSTPSASPTPYQPPNVSQYLAANQGAGQQLTQGITGNIQNQANQLNNNTTAAQNKSNPQYNSLNANLNTNTAQNVAQTAFQNPQQLLDSYNAAKTNSSNAPLSSDQQASADQYNQFQQLNNGGYNQAIQNYGNSTQQNAGQLQNQLSNLTQQTGSANNEMGRNQLLQNAVGQGNYNQGEQTLDSLFLQGAPGQLNSNGLSNLQQLQKNLGGIGNQATQAVQGFGNDAQAKLAALQGMSASDQAGIKNLFQNGTWSGSSTNPYNVNSAGLNQIAGNVGQEYTNAQNAQTAYQNGLSQNIANNTLSKQDVTSLGLTPGQQAWGVNSTANGNPGLNAFITNNALNANVNGVGAGNAQVATPEEYARFNALNQLAGGPNGLQTDIFGGTAQAAGQQPYNPFSFDTGKYNTAVDTAKNTITGNDYKNALNSAIAQLGSVGHMGGGSIAPWDLAAALQQGQSQNGGMTPDQAQQLFKQYLPSLQSMGAGLGDPMAGYNTYQNYINNEYNPAATDLLGQYSPTGGQAIKGHGPMVES